MLFCALLLCGLATCGAQVRFVKGSTDELRAAAVERGKLVFIDLYAVWCNPCRQMDAQVFSKRQVGEFFDRHFVAGKYSVDGAVGGELLRRYGSGSIPLYLIFDTEGNLLGRILGASPADRFLADLQRILDAVQPKDSGQDSGQDRGQDEAQDEGQDGALTGPPAGLPAQP